MDIGDNHAEHWKRWTEDVTHLSKFHVKRCLKPVDFGCTSTAQLHHFFDASVYAYGTVSYLLLGNTEGKKHSAFLIGKSRMFHMKLVIIHKPELTAAVVALRVEDAAA